MDIFLGDFSYANSKLERHTLLAEVDVFLLASGGASVFQ